MGTKSPGLLFGWRKKISNPETCTYGQRTLEMTQIFMIVITFDVP